MTDIRLTKLADVLVNYSTKVKQGDWVHIRAGLPAMPLVQELYSSILKAGGKPTFSIVSDELEALVHEQASDEQLKWLSPLDEKIISEADVYMVIVAPENIRAMSRIDPARQQVRQSGRRKWMDTYLSRSANGDLRWVLTNYPCLSLAQDSGKSLKQYEDFFYAATFIDQPDPVKCWQQVHDDQARLINWLTGRKQVRIQGVNADLTLSIDGRRFLNSDGDCNMPSGEIFTSPVETSANGWVRFTYPAIHLGMEVEGVRLEFKDGRVVSASAEKNQDFLLKMLDMDEGSRFLGELGIGTNFGIQEFSKDILFDEKIGGSFHLALGAGFGEAGGKNQSSLHWDLICDARVDTEMRVDGDLFYQNGKFVV